MKMLNSILKSNPWRKVADDWFVKMQDGGIGFEFVLPDDKGELAKARAKYKTNVPPQPFVGHPSSPIWLIMKNPGVGPWDECDLLNGRSGLSKSDRIHATEMADAGLLRRKELYRDQLKLTDKSDSAFSLLDASFDTAERKGGRKPRNTYLWYRRYLLSRTGLLSPFVDVDDLVESGRFVSRNLFALDFVPYRSKSFEDENSRFAHGVFWRKLMRYGLANKTVVFWGSRILNKIRNDNELASRLDVAISQNRIAVIKTQQMYFSASTTYMPMNTTFIHNALKRRS